MPHTLRFSQFGWGELQAQAQASGSSDVELAEAAIDELLERLAAGDRGPATTVPHLADQPAAHATLQVEVGEDAEAALAGEARAQGIETVRLLEYAVLAYLAAHSPD